MNSSVELKEEISFDEFKAWLNGLFRGKGKKTPDANDWVVIYKMMDKVVADRQEMITIPPVTTPHTPYVKPYNPVEIADPIPNPIYVGDIIPTQWEVTCTSSDGDDVAWDNSLGVFENACEKVGVCPDEAYEPPNDGAGYAVTSNSTLNTSTIAPSVQGFPNSPIRQYTVSVDTADENQSDDVKQLTNFWGTITGGIK